LLNWEDGFWAADGGELSKKKFEEVEDIQEGRSANEEVSTVA
jgi:hypothetical protein